MVIRNQISKVRDKYILIANGIRMNNKSKKDLLETISDIYDLKIIALDITIEGSSATISLYNKNDDVSSIDILVDNINTHLELKDSVVTINRPRFEIAFPDSDTTLYYVENVSGI